MDKKALNWIKQHKNLMKALLMSLLPLLAAALLCAADGKGIGDLSLTASEWNDEIFYYKQVEAILEYGFPQGYFGYNESHAKYLSFGTWSPVVLIPYILWGLLFGWNLISPIFCNIFLSMLGIFLFVQLTKPNRKQCAALAVLYLTSLFTVRYMLSGMSEIICAFWAVLYLGLCINYRENEKLYKLVSLYAIVGILSLIRPYYLIFILVPVYFAVKKYRWKAVFLSLGVAVSIGVLYVFTSRNLCTKYLVDSMSTTWLECYWTEGFFEGIRNTFLILFQNSKEFIKRGLADFRGTEEAVGLIGQFSMIVLVFIYQTAADTVKKKKKEAYWYGFFAASLLVILAAFFLLYYGPAFHRHFMVLITMGIFLISRMETRYFVKPVLVSLALLFFFYQVPAESESRRLHYTEPALLEEFSVWKELMDSEIERTETKVPNWDNVIIWVLSDVAEGDSDLEHSVTKWQLLYATPAGMGINCCLQSYILQNFDSLQSKYLAVIPGGKIEKLCEEDGKREIGRTENLVMYALR